MRESNKSSAHFYKFSQYLVTASTDGQDGLFDVVDTNSCSALGINSNARSAVVDDVAVVTARKTFNKLPKLKTRKT